MYVYIFIHKYTSYLRLSSQVLDPVQDDSFGLEQALFFGHLVTFAFIRLGPAICLHGPLLRKHTVASLTEIPMCKKILYTVFLFFVFFVLCSPLRSTLLSSMEVHCMMKAWQRGVGQMSSCFQMCSKTSDLCSGDTKENPRLVTIQRVSPDH